MNAPTQDQAISRVSDLFVAAITYGTAVANETIASASNSDRLDDERENRAHAFNKIVDARGALYATVYDLTEHPAHYIREAMQLREENARLQARIDELEAAATPARLKVVNGR